MWDLLCNWGCPWPSDLPASRITDMSLCGTRDPTQGSGHAGQALTQLTYTPQAPKFFLWNYGLNSLGHELRNSLCYLYFLWQHPGVSRTVFHLLSPLGCLEVVGFSVPGLAYLVSVGKHLSHLPEASFGWVSAHAAPAGASLRMNGPNGQTLFLFNENP